MQIRRSRLGMIGAMVLLVAAQALGLGTRTTLAAKGLHYTYTDLGTLGGGSSEALGINSVGQVVGDAYTTNDAAVDAFLWTPGTKKTPATMTDLGTLGGTESQGHGINSSGQVAGWSETTNNTTTDAFLWTPTTNNGTTGGPMANLGDLGGGYSYGYGINDSGEVVGFAGTSTPIDHAFLSSGGTMYDLGTLSGNSADYSYAYGINSSGQVAGDSRNVNLDDHAFLWTPTATNGTRGSMVDLGTLGGGYSHVNGINSSGQVVGYSQLSTGLDDAFVWTPTSTNGTSGTMTDLNTLTHLPRGVSLEVAYGINANGWIVGQAFVSASGNYHAFLLKP